MIIVNRIFQCNERRSSLTQIDRFSYQSTNCKTGSVIQEQKKKTLVMANYRNQLSVDVAPHIDFSDVDYDISDVESSNQMSGGKNSVQNYQPVSRDENKGSNTLTTSL